MQTQLMKSLKKRQLTIALVLLSALHLIVFPVVANENESPSLWSINGNVEKAKYSNGRLIQTPVAVNIHALAFGRLQEKAKFKLPVFHTTLEVQLESSKNVGDLTIWRASGDSSSRLPDTLIFVREGSVSAWIPTSKGTYRLRDGQLYKEVRTGGFKSDFKIPQISSLPVPSPINGTKQTSAKPDSVVRNKIANRQQAAGDNQYRVLFVVTNEFVSSFPDSESTINEYIAANNAIYESSGMNVELVSAGLIQSDLEGFTPDQVLDNISGSSSEDSTDGDISDDILQPIWEARLSARADFITVFFNDLEDGLCGQGWLNGDEDQIYNYNFAVNVTAAFTVFSGEQSQNCSIDTLGHELGHNMGLGHSLQQGAEGTVFTYGRGYGINDQFTTVMAYPQEFGTAEGLAFYSSPNIDCLGFPCGIDGSQSDGADAVAAVNAVKDEISLIHNDETTLGIDEALSDFDAELQSCILSANSDIITNEQLRSINCPNEEVDSFTGVEKLPKLVFVSLAAIDADLSPFQNIPNIDVLDFRSTNVTNLRPVAHLVEQLRFLQFSAVDMSCQDVNVVQSWTHISGNHPLNASSCDDLSNDAEDFDNDGITNLNDTDDDNDGIDDITDHLPFDASNADDIDADGVIDSEDAFPYNDSESLDTDNDTVGNNQDSDDDNDGVADSEDCAPLDNTLSSDCNVNENQAPIISGTPVTAVVVGNLYDFTPTASDGDGDGLAFSVQNSPEWASFDTSNGNLTGTPVESDVGTYNNIIITVSDGAAEASLSPFTIVVSNDNEAPVISGTPATSVQVGNQYSFTPEASDGDGDTLTFAIENQPDWSTFSSSNGQLTGTPDDSDVGVYSDISITVSDGELSASLTSFSITVTDGSSGGNTGFVHYDYDGDGKADVGVRRASNFFQYILNSSNDEIQRVQFGKNVGDITVSGDFDGDGMADVAVRRATNQFWYIKNSSDGETQRFNFGKQSEDIPVPADYDGDGITDIAVRRPSNFTFYILNSSDGEIQRIRFGLNADDIPVPADYDGDGKADVAVRRASNQFWYILNSSDGEVQRINFGKQEADIPIPADYDGDGKADVAVRRPSDFMFYILNSSDGQLQRIRFGLNESDIPIPADYDGDGKADVAVRRPSNQFQYILRTSDGQIERIQFGRNSADMPLAAPVSQRLELEVSAATLAREAASQDIEYVRRDILDIKEAMLERLR